MPKFVLNGSSETTLLAQIVSDHLIGGDLVILSGELGVGKTVFARSLLASLGVTQTVTSPTFVLVKSYVGRFPIDHVDIYRIDNPDELDLLCIGELLEDGHLVVIEWGEKALGMFGDSFIQLTFERISDEVSLDDELIGASPRFVTLDVVGSRFASRRASLEHDVIQHWSSAI